MPPSSTQLVMLRLDIFCGRVRGGCSGLGLFCGFFLWRFGPLCCTLYSSVHAPAALPAFVEPLAGHADESGAVTWIQCFFAALFGGFFVHLEGDPFTTFVLRYGLAWCCYWVTDRHSLFAGGWHTLKKRKNFRSSHVRDYGNIRRLLISLSLSLSLSLSFFLFEGVPATCKQ